MVAFKLAFKIVWFLHVSFLKNYAFVHTLVVNRETINLFIL